MTNDNSTKIIWQADSSHPAIADKIRETLRDVMDPELGLNVIQLGLVRDVIVSDETVHVKMILTTPFCPYGPALLEMSRKKVEETVKKPTTIEMSMEMWDFSMMEEGAGNEWGLF
jgi:metal-sulfur cluster biosynthetic enzyme